MPFLLALIALATQPQPCGILPDRFDLVELNHLYDEYGNHVFDQVIWWNWSHDDARYHVAAWKLEKCQGCRPRAEGSRWVSLWCDGDGLRVVTARSHRESWTQFDPELLERESLPKEQRRELVQLRRMPR